MSAAPWKTCWRTNPECVIATGGSIVSEPETYELLLRECFTVWLRAAPEDHMRRVREQGDTRPMENSGEAMADLKRDSGNPA